MRLVVSALGGLVGLLDLVTAQLPPTPKGLTILKSKFHENVTISYKEASVRRFYELNSASEC